jgi:hypothetical protein
MNRSTVGQDFCQTSNLVVSGKYCDDRCCDSFAVRDRYFFEHEHKSGRKPID